MRKGKKGEIYDRKKSERRRQKGEGRIWRRERELPPSPLKKSQKNETDKLIIKVENR